MNVRLSNHLVVQCGRIFAEHAKTALPLKQKLRGPCFGVPLWAVISSARSHATGARGITAIREGTFIYRGYRTFGAAINATAERIGKRHCLTFVQVDLLAQVIAKRHRGRPGDAWSLVLAGVVGEGFYDHCNAGEESRQMVVEALQRHKMPWPPIAALIDPRLTNLILLKQLEVILASKRREQPCRSKQTRSQLSAMCAA